MQKKESKRIIIPMFKDVGWKKKKTKKRFQRNRKRFQKNDNNKDL